MTYADVIQQLHDNCYTPELIQEMCIVVMPSKFVKAFRNENFTSDEFFEIKDGKVVCEMGYPMAAWYKGEPWQKTGWSIFNETL
ncbi:hypothetical protein vBSflM004_067 [Shigella phage vB_SflM_004]|nr:hypothetical protein vBSflM004_067 [Shigella phage vB_SflM_004]